MDSETLFQAHGGYRKLKTFQIARLIYDVTVRFCDRYIDQRSRTHDQMVQAARSGAQNIAEGSKMSATTKKLEMKLTGVARASLEELYLDYEDFLRHRGLEQWNENDPRRQELVDRRCKTADEVACWVKEIYLRGNSGHSRPRGQAKDRSTMSTVSTPQGTAANAVLVLLKVVIELLRRQLSSQAAAFRKDGGFTERLYRFRKGRL